MPNCPTQKTQSSCVQLSSPTHDFGPCIAVGQCTDQGANRKREDCAGKKCEEGHGSFSDAFTIARMHLAADRPKERKTVFAGNREVL